MSQEFYVLRCYSCENYQVHIVKKNKKWQCKVCNEKQSFIRHFGAGDSKDCRNKVMKLNEVVKMKMFELDDEKNCNKKKSETETFCTKLDENIEAKKPKSSKWLQYLDEDEFESEEETTEIFDRLSDDCSDIKKPAKKRKVTHEKDLSEDLGATNTTNWNFMWETKDDLNLDNEFVNIKQQDINAKAEAAELKSSNPEFIKEEETKKRKFEEYWNDSVPKKKSSPKPIKINCQKNIFSSDSNDFDEIMNINF